MTLATTGEWKRAAWAYSPVALSHNGTTLVRALHSFLTQSGWELAPWSGSGDDRHYLRADRRSVNFTNDANGASGNVAITKTGASITVVGMTGGGVSTPATGHITLSANPSDGEFFTISDGVTSVGFEFDSNASTSGGRTAITIGSTLLATIDTLVTVLNAHAFNVTASLVSDVWRYNGDSSEQVGGIHVQFTGGVLNISSFLEAVTGDARQVETTTSGYGSQNQKIRVTPNNTVVNEWLFYGGEDGLYIEVGIDGDFQNVGHGAIMTFMPIPDFSGTKDPQRKWSAQGLSCDLFGSLKFSEDRNYRFVDNNGSNKNYTGRLRPYTPRGVYDLLAPSPVDNAAYYIAPRDNFIGVRGGGTSGVLDANMWWCSFGLLNSPIDDRYKISPLWMLQHLSLVTTKANSASSSNSVAPDGGEGYFMEPRWIRKIPRFASPDQTLLPFVNVSDSLTDTVYRISQVDDNGRTFNIAVEYPADLVTVPTTPSV